MPGGHIKRNHPNETKNNLKVYIFQVLFPGINVNTLSSMSLTHRRLSFFLGLLGQILHWSNCTIQVLSERQSAILFCFTLHHHFVDGIYQRRTNALFSYISEQLCRKMAFFFNRYSHNRTRTKSSAVFNVSFQPKPSR